MHTNHFLQKRRTYRPGDTTVFGREVTEWQVGLVLRPTNPTTSTTAVPHAVASDAQLSVTLYLLRFDGIAIPFSISLPLSCVLGWQLPTVLTSHGAHCNDGARDARGAVLFSAGALHGRKKRSAYHYRELANFAARALLGALRFDAVVIAVVVDFSASDVQMRCGPDVLCAKRLDEANRRMINGVAVAVEEEMARLRVPPKLFERVVLVTSCRLGSDAIGSERGNPCRVSKQYGQYYASFFSYAMLAPFFKVCYSLFLFPFLFGVIGYG